MTDRNTTMPDLGVSAEDLLKVLADRMSGSTAMVAGEGVEFYDGTKILVPTGTTYEAARDIIDRAEREAGTETRWHRVYPYRFNDGAHALLSVLKRRYGGAFGERTMHMFGSEPPQLRTIDISTTAKAQVPEGRLSLPALKGVSLIAHEASEREYGNIFGLVVTGPRRFAAEIDALFADIDSELAGGSIYRGSAIVGANAPQFIDLTGFDPAEIVFSTAASRLLENTLWAPLRHADDLRAERIPLKRAVLLHGPYGTGKTSAGLVTAQLAVEHGWTAVFAKAGRDSIEDTLRTARLYQPAVLFIEDIDNETSTGDTEKVSRLLEALDGATSKGSEIMLVVTTNHLDRIHKGMLRPGRFDAVIEIAALDAAGVERLIKAVVGDRKLDPDTDYAQVAKAMAGFFPAFVREAVDRARTLAITRHGRIYTLSTDELVAAAETLNAQLRAMEAATEGEPTPTLDATFRSIMRGSLDGYGWVHREDDPIPDAYLMDPEKADLNGELRNT
ncbi:hypothetical protein GCM10009557_00520 [Virgisporangium ochraceum]|uniref:AAA+ ATPase domain-containing protein n=1 Tax=Virgisporangium ochraceum TaxID=65505 RepID=A0A8J4A1G9_9ACTN|nr:ATP-binding protein [Virgisporangium ochraceum]GIJ74084.1 hypothetical protein Voc01_090010 [Virgisporangium ochraceum]